MNNLNNDKDALALENNCFKVEHVGTEIKLPQASEQYYSKQSKTFQFSQKKILSQNTFQDLFVKCEILSKCIFSCTHSQQIW